MMMDNDEYFENDGYFDEGIVPPNPFGMESGNGAAHIIEQENYDDENDDVESQRLSLRVKRFGLGVGVVVGIAVQLATLAGDYVNVMAWGTDDGPYANTTFIIWCCFMCSMFFFVFLLLRFLVQLSFQISEEHSTVNVQVADVPSESPMPNLFPRIRHRGDPNMINQGQEVLLEDITFHMKCYYTLGINIGISLSWIATNSLLQGERVSLFFALVPATLGVFYFTWMKQNYAYRKVEDNNDGEGEDSDWV